MRIETAHNLFRIHNLKTFAREVPIEGDLQIVQITKLVVSDIPDVIDDLMELEVWRSGKVPERFRQPNANRTHPLPLT